MVDKRNCSDVFNHVGTGFRIALLKSILVAVRGAVGKKTLLSHGDNLGNVFPQSYSICD